MCVSVLYICSLYPVQLLVLPNPQSPWPHGQNFIRIILLGAKLLAHSFLLTTSFVILPIIKAQFLEIVQSEQNNYP